MHSFPVERTKTMKRDTFSSYHPIVNQIYFVAVIGFTMFLMHPVCIAISLLCAVTYNVYINGKKAIRFNLIFMLPLLLLTAVLNPLFNHQGATILTYLPGGNPLTLESIAYGVAAAFLLITVVSWFSCLSAVMTTDKIVYLFGRLIPALSLVLSMSLRLIPRFRNQIKVISNAQKCIGRDVSGGSVLQRIKRGVKNISILITWALENAIETADSMKGRGYGLPGRTAFSIFRFTRRDACALACILALTAVMIVGAATGAYRFLYYPYISGQYAGAGTVALFAAYFILCVLPLVVNVKEDIIWYQIKTKT